MAECKDCLHDEVCKGQSDVYFKLDIMSLTKVECICPYFKLKSKYVEVKETSKKE